MPSTIRVDGWRSTKWSSLLAKARERCEDGEEAERVQHEADAGAESGDDDSRDRGSDHARAVEEAGVQRDRVR